MLDEDMLDAIYEFFQQRGYHWKLNDKFVDPDIKMIEELLVNMHKIVAEEDNLSLRQGRLMVQNDGEHCEIWIYAGEIE